MKRLIPLLSAFFIASCSSAPSATAPESNFEIKEITPEFVRDEEQAQQQCINQVAYILAVDEKKAAGVPEHEILLSIEKHRRVMLKVGNEYPMWLYNRYQQLARDIYRVDRNIETYSDKAFEECIVGELYLTEEE